MNANGLIDTLATAQVKARGRALGLLAQQWLGQFAFFALYGFAALFMLGINWVYGDWQWNRNPLATVTFWFGLAFISIILLATFFNVMGRFVKVPPIEAMRTRNRISARAQAAFLAALAAPDDVLLPALPYQPAVATPPLTRQRQRVAPLSSLVLVPPSIHWWRIFAASGLAIALIPLTLLLPIADVLRGNAHTLGEFQAAREIFDPIVLWFVFSFIVGYGIFYSTFLFKGWHVLANEQGLSWRRFGRWVLLPWSAMRTIGIYADDAASSTAIAHYIIASETMLITWKLPLVSATAPWLNPVRDSAATERMLAIVMAQTGLPLRDLRPLAQASAQAVNTTFPAATSITEAARRVRPTRTAPPARTAHPVRLVQPNSALATMVSQRIAETPLPAWQHRRWGVVAPIIGLFLVIALSPYLLSNYLHDAYLPRYLATIPARLHAKSAMLHNSLLVPGQGWPQHALDANKGDTITSTPAGYTITNGGGMGVVVLPDTYYALAIQVTVRMNGTVQGDDANQTKVGIVVRHHSSSLDKYYDCRLLISMQGQWRDTCGYNPTTLNGDSSYIHQGDGATNTLMAVARGQFYSFYLNGHFVGYNYDQYGEPFGQIGLINQVKGVRASFTDFTVWALNPPPNPFII